MCLSFEETLENIFESIEYHCGKGNAKRFWCAAAFPLDGSPQPSHDSSKRCNTDSSSEEVNDKQSLPLTLWGAAGTFHTAMKPVSALAILNPKRQTDAQTGRASWYPYYAGFSSSFARALLGSARLSAKASVIDPWNGSGTTTAAAAGLGYVTLGFDLNPVMVIAAKARVLSKRLKSSLIPLGAAILKAARNYRRSSFSEGDPFCTWLAPASALHLRSVEHGLRSLLLPENTPTRPLKERIAHSVSDLAAFFYLALFRSTRCLLQPFVASNPTWVKKPTRSCERLRPSREQIFRRFAEYVATMTGALAFDPLNNDSEVTIAVGSSESLPLSDGSVDFVLTSPPYCTRIDYAIATLPELAVLGYRLESEVESLRRMLIGSPTVPSVAPQPKSEWGETCIEFLDNIADHRSRASSSYYLKNHLQYFQRLNESLRELSRAMRRGSTCVLVVQDSYYKEVHNNLPTIISEMGESHNLSIRRRVDFAQNRSMVRINPRVKQYRRTANANEAVLCFVKN
jgi:DNA modification methylase